MHFGVLYVSACFMAKRNVLGDGYRLDGEVNLLCLHFLSKTRTYAAKRMEPLLLKTSRGARDDHIMTNFLIMFVKNCNRTSALGPFDAVSCTDHVLRLHKRIYYKSSMMP